MFWHNVRLLNATAALLMVCAVLLLLGAAAWRVAHLPMFTLRELEVQPAPGAALRHVNAATIRANINGKFTGNFFTANLDAVRAAFESVPWVRRASVRRSWPDGLQVQIEEHTAMGTWGGGESPQLVNLQGEVFVANIDEAEADLAPGARLIALRGPEGSSKEMVSVLKDVGGWFAPLGWRPVELVLSPRYAWTVRFDGGTRVELGRDLGEQDRATIAARAARFVRSWPLARPRLANKELDYADLRYTNGFAVRQGTPRVEERNDESVDGT
ncbi:MAG: cell division protein FtsQ/DivIB [Candidatus Protistobacter heckmanni]|nr:cell division protein FtsQ/DivIB [Candidatus Protistobacter heckmanni]